MLHKAPIQMVSRVYPSHWRLNYTFLCSVLVSASLTPLTSGPSGSSLLDGMILVLNRIRLGMERL